MAKSKKRKKRKRYVRKDRTVIGKDGFTYTFNRYGKVTKIQDLRLSRKERRQQKLVEASIRQQQEETEKFPMWLFECPIDDEIALPISNLSPDTDRHCLGLKENSDCPFIAEGCTGCNLEAKAQFQEQILNELLNRKI